MEKLEPMNENDAVALQEDGTVADCATADANAAASDHPSLNDVSSSPAQQCDRDSLSIVFSFCNSMLAVARAARVCRSWRAAAARPQSSCHIKVCLPIVAVKRMLESPLRIHIAAWATPDKNKFASAISAADLLLLSARLPWLEELDISVNSASVAALTQSADGLAAFKAAAWPQSLRRLELNTDSTGMQPLLDALPLSAPLLESLRSAPLPSIDLSPLLLLAHLTTLYFTASRQLTPTQLAVVKQLSGLTSLDANCIDWSVADLRTLLLDDPHHQLHKLRHIKLSNTSLTEEHMDALLKLPNLTMLRPYFMYLGALRRLAAFTQLQQLRIHTTNMVSPLHADQLLASLCQMRMLRVFHLLNVDYKAEGLSALLRGLAAAVPQLMELSLAYSTMPTSLDSLRALHQLRSLTLCRCDFPGDSSCAALLSLLPSLPLLESLHVLCCDPPLTYDQRACLMPPSALVPTLCHFEWR